MISGAIATHTQIGPVSISIIGNSPVSGIFSSQLEAVQASNGAPLADLEVVFLKSKSELPPYIPAIYSAKALMSFNDSSLFVGYHPNFDYLLENPFGTGPTKLYLISKKVSYIRSLYAGPRRVVESVLSYQLFWYVFHLALQKKGGSFFHASVLECNGEAVAMTGTGGGGKTSSLFHLLDTNPQTRYLAEDFGVIDGDGIAHYNPKHVSIYDSDTRQNLLKGCIDRELSITKRVAWSSRKHLLHKNPRLKVSPRSVIGNDRIGSQARLKQAFFMVRGEYDAISVARISSDELIDRTLHVTYREMKFLVELSRLVSANKPASMPHLSPDELVARNREIYQAAFGEIDSMIIRIPSTFGPERITPFIWGI